MPDVDDSSVDWKESIVAAIKREGGDDDANDSEKLEVKSLRKKVLKLLDFNVSEKDAKKKFKKTMKGLQEEGVVAIDAEGRITLVKSKKRKKAKMEKKEKKKLKKSEKHSEENEKARENYDSDKGAKADDKDAKTDDKDAESKLPKGTPCKGNPQGITRIFLGNLPFSVDETALCEFLPDTVTHIKWITDKETGKFYGSAFIEMDCPLSAAETVAMAGEKLMNRPLKINYAPARPGDVWPPEKRVIKGGNATTGGQAGGSGVKAMGSKPENCVKLFIGNLSYEIDDDTIFKFFDNVGAEVKAVRWLSHRETGDFKGCGFVEFWNGQACEKAATQNGKNLLGRPIRIDWTD